MCGIVGIISKTEKPINGHPLSKMLSCLSHRGPDQHGAIYREGVALGARRLSLVDIPHGLQPFWNQSGSIVAVMNGEIFNYPSLRAQLQDNGVNLRTRCDTEIVPALYELKGEKFIEDLNGQFSIAIYDFRDNKLLLYRDRFGICPLFYTEVEGVLLFASEIKAFLDYPGFNASLDLRGLDQILTFPGTVSPTTMYRGVYSLQPGHLLKARINEESQVVCYWDLAFTHKPDPVNEEDLVDELDALLTTAVRERLSEEVPTGVYLSGGLDSSLVAAMVRKHRPRSVIDAFAIDFDEKLISERQFQDLAASHLNLDATTGVLSVKNILDRLQRVVWHTETPLRETFNAASLYLSEMARRAGYKVVLAGQGADEMFAGYVGYRFDVRSRGNQMLDATEREFNLNLTGSETFLYERKYAAFADVKDKLLSRDAREALQADSSKRSIVLGSRPAEHLSPLQRRSYLDCKLRLADHLLSGHGDRMAMANHVEVRYPFLCNDVVNFALRLPDHLKLNRLKEKYILKLVGRRYLPDAIVEREKFGFTAPGSPALIRMKDERIEHYLSEEYILRHNVFDVEEVARLKSRYSAPGFRIAVPFESDLLITVITYGMLADAFGMVGLQ